MSEDIAGQNKKSVNSLPNPWRRFFARSVDMSIYLMFINIFTAFVLRWNVGQGDFGAILELVFSTVLMVILEPLLLSTWGSTPGKWALGLVLRTGKGDKLTYGNGLERMLLLIKDGYGFQIPIYSFYRQYKSFKTCSNGEELSFDYGYDYTLIDTKGFRIAILALMSIVIVTLSTFTMMRAEMPINRGDITVAQYYENCNDYMDYNNMELGKEMDENGNWVTNSDTYYLGDVVFGNQMPYHQVLTEGDKVTGIVIEVEAVNEPMVATYAPQMIMAYNSLVGADMESTVFNLYSDVYRENFSNGLIDFSFEQNGYLIRNTVEHKGYHESEYYLFSTDDEETYFHMVFVIEKI